MVRRAPGRPRLSGDRAGRNLVADGRGRGPGGTARGRIPGAVRRRAAVPAQGAGGRRAAVAAGPPQRRAGGRGLPAGGTAGHSGELAGPQLPGHVAQAGVVGGAAAVRGAGRFSSGVSNHRAAAGIRGLRPGPVHRPAQRPVRRRRSARAVHHLDHRAATRHRRAGARRARRRDPVRQLGRKRIRRRGQDGARTRRTLSRRCRGAGGAVAQPHQPGPRRHHLP